MCELLIQRADKLPPGDPQHHTFYAAGDVVAVLPDDWTYGRAELGSPDFLVLRVPDLSQTEAAPLLAPMRVGDGQLPRMRAFALDLSHPAIAGKTSVNAADVKAATVARDPLPDPKYIGINPRVIG